MVRTDSHLEFYEDTKNLARMSDILAVYAWVDPATGYCQGCSFVFWVEPFQLYNYYFLHGNLYMVNFVISATVTYNLKSDLRYE